MNFDNVIKLMLNQVPFSRAFWRIDSTTTAGAAYEHFELNDDLINRMHFKNKDNAWCWLSFDTKDGGHVVTNEMTTAALRSGSADSGYSYPSWRAAYYSSNYPTGTDKIDVNNNNSSSNSSEYYLPYQIGGVTVAYTGAHLFESTDQGMYNSYLQSIVGGKN